MELNGERNPRRDLELYAIMRAYARDEGELINQRLNWLGVSQSVLLTGYAALLTFVGSNDVRELALGLTTRAFGTVIEGGLVLYTVFGAIALTGALLCVLTFVNLAGAFQSEETVKVKWNEYLKHSADPDLRAHLPYMAFGFNPKGGMPAPSWRVGMVIIPIFFTALWTVLGGFAMLLVRSALVVSSP